jgi:hypothetical protein
MEGEGLLSWKEPEDMCIMVQEVTLMFTALNGPLPAPEVFYSFFT